MTLKSKRTVLHLKLTFQFLKIKKNLKTSAPNTTTRTKDNTLTEKRKSSTKQKVPGTCFLV